MDLQKAKKYYKNAFTVKNIYNKEVLFMPKDFQIVLNKDTLDIMAVSGEVAINLYDSEFEKNALIVDYNADEDEDGAHLRECECSDSPTEKDSDQPITEEEFDRQIFLAIIHALMDELPTATPEEIIELCVLNQEDETEKYELLYKFLAVRESTSQNNPYSDFQEFLDNVREELPNAEPLELSELFNFLTNDQCEQFETLFNALLKNENKKQCEVEQPESCSNNVKPYYVGKDSLYQFAKEWDLNAYEFDLVKRIVRCRQKGEFTSDLNKSKDLIDIYLREQSENFEISTSNEVTKDMLTNCAEPVCCAGKAVNCTQF